MFQKPNGARPQNVTTNSGGQPEFNTRGCYKLTKKSSIAGEIGVPLFFLNDLFDDEATDPFSNYYNNPRYIQNYRSSINHVNYITFNTSLIYSFK